jgi:hypothetical protein
MVHSRFQFRLKHWVILMAIMGVTSCYFAVCFNQHIDKPLITNVIDSILYTLGGTFALFFLLTIRVKRQKDVKE